jgi:hypothetical protein
VVNGWKVRSLTVVAGPTAVGKTWLLRLLAADDQLRNRLGMPQTTRAVTPRELLKLKPSDPIDELVVHYDILKPHHKRFSSHAEDPSMAALHSAQAIAFFTLRTTPERLAAQLNRRIASREQPSKKLQELKPLYDEGEFVADWYDRWFRFVDVFRDVTTANYVLDTHSDYRLTPVSARQAFA